MAHLDRVVIVRVTTGGGFDNDGFPLPETTTDHRVWAERLSGALERTVTGEGARVDGTVTWRTRWTAALAAADVAAGVRIIDPGPPAITWLVQSRGESAGRRFQRLDAIEAVRRRRWLDWQCIEALTAP